MQTKIQKWGNSYAVRLPIEIIKKQSLAGGDLLNIAEKKGRIILDIIDPGKKESLKSLVNKIKPENLHSESNWGGARGREAW